MLRCPSCHTSLDAAAFGRTSLCQCCGFLIDQVEGIQLLIKDREKVERTISDARQRGLDAWYTKTQLGQWTGPYRHHMRKRRDWVEAALTEWKAQRRERQFVGLDLGCGDGSNLQWLHEHCPVLYASDYNCVRLLRAAGLRTHARLLMADVCDFPASDCSFDVIFFNHVLEHIPDDSTALLEVCRILKPEGLVILGVPNEGEVFWQLAYRLQPKSRLTSDHRHYYTADTISAKCNAAGLRVRAVHRMGWGVPHWSLDAIVRRFKWVDDGLEAFGRRLFPRQASSLYLLLSK